MHGTDTLAYTASALSFMLENLGKAVIVTGNNFQIFFGYNKAHFLLAIEYPNYSITSLLTQPRRN